MVLDGGLLLTGPGPIHSATPAMDHKGGPSRGSDITKDAGA